MKRSELNNAVLQAKAHFEKNGWAIPPDPQWDVTDFGLGEFEKSGLVLLNLADEPEYCEKLMFAKKGRYYCKKRYPPNTIREKRNQCAHDEFRD